MRAVISSSAGFQSDMHLIVEQCVAQVREAAGLASFDAEVVLPRALPLPKKPPPLPRKLPPPLPKEVESSNALLGVANTVAWDELAAALPSSAPTAIPIPRANVPTVVAKSRTSRRAVARWPLFLCAFVAAMSATAAFIASPAGHRPAVRHVVLATQAQATHALASLRAIR